MFLSPFSQCWRIYTFLLSQDSFSHNIVLLLKTINSAIRRFKTFSAKLCGSVELLLSVMCTWALLPLACWNHTSNKLSSSWKGDCFWVFLWPENWPHCALHFSMFFLFLTELLNVESTIPTLAIRAICIYLLASTWVRMPIFLEQRILFLSLVCWLWWKINPYQ